MKLQSLTTKNQIMAGKGRPKKEFHEYLNQATDAHVGHKDYLKSPASAFLKYSIEAKDAIDLCIRQFPKKKDTNFTKDSLDSLQHLTVAILPAVMGHFETFQRYLFAGMFDLSVYLTDFKIKEFIHSVSPQEREINIDFERLAAFRNIGAGSIGFVVADNLKGWHNPSKVNSYFNAIAKFQFFSNEDIKRVQVLWQLRHSIVHTGGTLTLPDAQKVEELSAYSDKIISFEKNMIYEISRKLHPIIKNGTDGLKVRFKARLKPGLDARVNRRIEDFFEVKSSIPGWFV